MIQRIELSQFSSELKEQANMLTENQSIPLQSFTLEDFKKGNDVSKIQIFNYKDATKKGKFFVCGKNSGHVSEEACKHLLDSNAHFTVSQRVYKGTDKLVHTSWLLMMQASTVVAEL